MTTGWFGCCVRLRFGSPAQLGAIDQCWNPRVLAAKEEADLEDPSQLVVWLSWNLSEVGEIEVSELVGLQDVPDEVVKCGGT